MVMLAVAVIRGIRTNGARGVCEMVAVKTSSNSNNPSSVIGTDTVLLLSVGEKVKLILVGV